MLTLSNIVKVYGRGRHQHLALKGLDLHVEEGEFFTLLGPSGCGKTTALRCIAGLEVPSSGEICIGGAPVYSSERRLRIPAEKRDVAMVFQSYAVWPHMSVAQNVGFPLDVQGLDAAQKKRRIQETLELVGLSAMANRPATDLSGGQQQRVSIARAIIRGSKILLLDEPLSNLDAELRVQMRNELRELQQLLGVTTIFVTHDQEEAISMSDRIAVFNHGELVEVGRPIDLYLRPRKPFTATFLGLAELLPCTLLETEGQGGTALVKASFGEVRASRVDACQGHDARLLIRPEHIVLQPAASAQHGQANSYRGIVKKAAFAGRYIDYQIQLGRDTIAAQAPSTQFHQVGDEVAVHMPADRCVLLES